MVLMVVDVQAGIVNEGLYDFSGFVRRVSGLICAARKNGAEIMFIRHDDGQGAELSPGNAGFEIYEKFAPMPGEMVFDKRVNSPFRESGALEYLRKKGERTIMAVGLQTDFCMDACVKCGFEHGFEMIIPEGTNSTFDNGFMSGEQTVKYYNEYMWAGRYGRCVSYEMALKMIGG